MWKIFSTHSYIALANWGAAWRSYSIGAGIEELRRNRDENQRQIEEEESLRQKMQEDLQILTKKLHQINDSLAKKVCPLQISGSWRVSLWKHASKSHVQSPSALTDGATQEKLELKACIKTWCCKTPTEMRDQSCKDFMSGFLYGRGHYSRWVCQLSTIIACNWLLRIHHWVKHEFFSCRWPPSPSTIK